MRKHNAKTYVLFIAVPLAVGALSAFLSREGREAFETLRRPSLSPPAAVFPIVGTILYILMGISTVAALGLLWSGSAGKGRQTVPCAFSARSFS